MAEDSYYTNTARALFGQGLAMGWGDEIEAKLRSFSGDETYAQELAKINREAGTYGNGDGKDACHTKKGIVMKKASVNRGSKTDQPGDVRARGSKKKIRIKKKK